MKENIMGTKPMTPLLLGMAFPIMISMLVQALYNVVDSIFVARLSDAALTAVSFAYPVQMTTFPRPVGQLADAFSGATPLAAVKAELVSHTSVNYQDVLFGSIPGSLGEVSALLLLVGAVYLLWRKVITWHIPVAVLGTMAVFVFLVGLGQGMHGEALWEFPLFHLLAGGAILGAVYMATDYSTSPMTHTGMLIYGVGIGIITVLIRLWGAYPEGMSFAILIMNSVVPLINKYVKPRRFGLK